MSADRCPFWGYGRQCFLPREHEGHCRYLDGTAASPQPQAPSDMKQTIVNVKGDSPRTIEGGYAIVCEAPETRCKHGVLGDECFECFPYGYAAKPEAPKSEPLELGEPDKVPGKQLLVFGDSSGEMYRASDVEALLERQEREQFKDLKVFGMTVEQVDYLRAFYTRTTGKDIRSEKPAPQADGAEVFTAADFGDIGQAEFLCGDAELIAEHANRILQERSVVVYGRDDNATIYRAANCHEKNMHWQARMLGVRPIVRDTADDVVRALLDYAQIPGDRRSAWTDLLERARKLLGATHSPTTAEMEHG